MSIEPLIEKINTLSDCIVYSPSGMPIILGKNQIMPDDLEEFYRLCGGISLFGSSPYGVKILETDNIVPANPVLIDKEIIEAEIEKGTYEEEISNDWYIVADLGDSNYIVIDLNKERLGRCYRAFWECYPSVGDMPIIALSFTELLERLINNRGEYWCFLHDDFNSYGDAYDGII